VHTAWQDIRFALKHLRRSPGFSAATMVTLTIGIAAVCSVFTLVNAALLRPLPYPDPGEIVFLRGELRRDTPREYPLSVLDLQDAAAERRVFDALSPVTGMRPFNLAFGAEVEHVNGEMVSEDYFRIFSMPLSHGRTFTAADVRSPGAAPLVILSHGFWTRRFGAEGGVVGRRLTLNERTFEVIGVAAPGFRGLTGEADLFLPIGMANPVYGAHYTDMRQFRWLSGVARLRDGVTVDAAREALHLWSVNMARAHPEENKDLFITVTPLQTALFGSSRPALLALMGASAFVLLIGCVNVANLLLARGRLREREVAVRRALGAGTRRVFQQLLTESLVLAAPACLAGILAATVLTTYLAAVWAADFDSFLSIDVDTRAILVTVALSTLAALGFGLVPAITAARSSPQRGLTENSRGSTISRARRRFQAALVVAEVALALTLLAGAGLMSKGLSGFLAADLGFRAEGVATLRLDLTADRYRDNARYWSTLRAVLDAARATPGATAAALEGPGYPTGGYFAATFRKHGAPADAPQVSTLRHHVSPGYFGTLGISLLAGRDFDDTDSGTSPRHLIVSRALAERTWPGENPIGQRLVSIGPDPPTWTVIGVVGNVRHEGRESVAQREPDVYLPIFQSPARSPSLLTVLARASTAPAVIEPMLVDAVTRAAPGLPPYDVTSMPDRLDGQTTRERLAVRLMLGFAMAALLLAVIGVYGVISYGVSMRTREIGIRSALGATRAQAVWMVLRGALPPLVSGIILGLAGVAALQRFVRSLLYGADPGDPLILGGTAVLLLAIGVAASVVPAVRASRVAPVTALRAE
jgi:predicted permease